MAAKGDMSYVWAKDKEILEKGECGGAVTALLKYALESKFVDAVLAVRKGQDIYDAVPAFITDPAEVASTAGSLHCGTLLLPKILKNYADGAKGMKIAVTCKGCDVMAFYELAKRNQVNLDNIVMIGVNCGGSVSPVGARKMIAEKFGVTHQAISQTLQKSGINPGSALAARNAEKSAAATAKAMEKRQAREAARQAGIQKISDLWKAGAKVEEIRVACGLKSVGACNVKIVLLRRKHPDMFPLRHQKRVTEVKPQ